MNRNQSPEVSRLQLPNSTAAPPSNPSLSLECGFRSSHAAVKKFFRGYEWMVGNLPHDQRFKLDTLLHHGIRIAELLEPNSTRTRVNPAIETARDELNHAFAGTFVSPELSALVDTCHRASISPALLQEGFQAADHWTLEREFQTFDELHRFADSIGGALMTAAVPVLGFVKAGYEQAARDCGAGVLLLQLLANFSTDASQNRVFLARQDIEDCQIALQRIKLRQSGPEIKHVVRLYCHRIEKILTAGGKLVTYLDFDGRRSVTSLLAMHWKMLLKMKLDPASIFHEDGVLSKSEWFRLRSRHLLGLEGNIPIIASETHH